MAEKLLVNAPANSLSAALIVTGLAVTLFPACTRTM
jgi:hypothetical protein